MSKCECGVLMALCLHVPLSGLRGSVHVRAGVCSAGRLIRCQQLHQHQWEVLLDVAFTTRRLCGFRPLVSVTSLVSASGLRAA